MFNILTTNVLSQALDVFCLPAGMGLLEAPIIRKPNSLSGKKNIGNDPKFLIVQACSEDDLPIASCTVELLPQSLPPLSQSRVYILFFFFLSVEYHKGDAKSQIKCFFKKTLLESLSKHSKVR